jgi:hypothetical protein
LGHAADEFLAGHDGERGNGDDGHANLHWNRIHGPLWRGKLSCAKSHAGTIRNSSTDGHTSANPDAYRHALTDGYTSAKRNSYTDPCHRKRGDHRNYRVPLLLRG